MSKNKGKSTFIKKNPTQTLLLLSFLIPFIVVFIGLVLGSFAPFGSKDVMTAGGMSKHLTYYYELYDRVHEGNGLVYSLINGSGYDFTSIFTNYLSDPLNLILLIVPRTAIPASVNLLYAIKIGLAGLFFAYFLRHRSSHSEKESKFNFPIFGFSVAYALSTYMLGQGMNITHLTVVALFPLLLVGLDKLLTDGKWRLYAAILTACVFCSIQMAIIVFLFTLLYAALFDYTSLSHAIRNLFMKLISDLLAIGAGAVIILNSVGSTSFQEEISIKFPQGSNVTTFFDVFKSLLPVTQASSSTKSNYGIDVFCGFLMIILLILYLGNPNIALSRRIRQSGILVALGSGLFLVTPNYLFNGFSHPEMTYCLFGFLFVAQLLSMGYEEFLNLEHTPGWQLHVTLLVLAGMIPASFCLCDTSNSIHPFLYAAGVLVIYYILLVLFHHKKMSKQLLHLILPLLLVAEVGITYAVDLRMAGSNSVAYEDTLDSQYYETAKVVQKTVPGSQSLIYDTKKNTDTPVTNTLLNYRFILIDKNSDTIADSTLTHLGNVGNVAVYRNEYAANGVFLPKSVEDWVYQDLYSFSSLDNLTKNYMNSVPVFLPSHGNMTKDYGILYDENGKEDTRHLDYLFTYRSTSEGDLYASLSGIHHLGSVKAGAPATFSITYASWSEIPEQFEAEYAFFYPDAFKVFYDLLFTASPEQQSESESTYNINATEDGYLLVPFSNLSGWDISVNGTSVTPSAFMDRALLIPVTKGENTIHLAYHPPLLIWGIVISVLVLALLILLAVKDHIRMSADSRRIHSLSDWLQANHVYILTFAITTLIFLLMQMYTGSLPFGDRSTLIGDGYLQAYNGYSGTVDSIKQGTYSPLNWNIGVAIDQYNNYIGHILSPWSFLKYLLMPKSLYMIDLTFSYYLNLILPGLAIILYLTHRRRGERMLKTDRRLLIIGVCYSLSSYAINYFVYGNFTFLIYAPLLVLAMERLVYDKKPLLYIILLYMQMGDAYYAFMLCEFLALMFFTLEFESVKDFFRKGIRFAAASVAAAGLACFRLIPYYMKTLESPYKVADNTSPVEKVSGSFLSLFSDGMTYRNAVITTSDDYRVNYYIGILLLLVIPLYLLNKRVKLSVRIRYIVLLALYFVAFGNSTLNYIFHGFHYQSLVPNRFSAFFIFLLVVVFYECLLSWQEYDRTKFCLGIGVPGLILAGLWTVYALTSKEVESTAVIASMIFLGIYLLLSVLQLWKKHRLALRRGIILLCMIEVILNALYIFPEAIGTNMADYSDPASIETLAERNKDMQKPFMATEYISDYYNAAESTSITSDSFFSSNVTMGHVMLFTKWNLITSTNAAQYLSGNPLADMMLHIKYNITNGTSKTSKSHYPTIDRAGALELHENSNYLPLGVFFEENPALDSWNEMAYTDFTDQHGGSALIYQNAFSRALGCDDLYHMIELEQAPSSTTEEENTTYITLDASDSVDDLQYEIPIQIHLAKDVEGDIYLSYANAITYVATAQKGTSDVIQTIMYLPSTQSNYTMQIASCDEEAFKKLYTKLNDSVLEDIEIDFTTVRGQIQAPKDGTVFLSLPYMEGWSTYVDGIKAEHTSFLGGIGVPVSAGNHTIEIVYTPRGMWLGISISCGTLLLLIIYAFIHRQLKHRRKAEPY